MITLTLTRASLSLTDLVIGSDPFTGAFHIPEEGVDWPRFPKRRTAAPLSGIVGGLVPLALVDDIGVMPATIYAKGTTMALLKTAREELEAAVGQFTYDLTLAIDGQQIGTWEALGESVDWGPIDSGMVRGRMCRASIAFSLQPGTI